MGLVGEMGLIYRQSLCHKIYSDNVAVFCQITGLWWDVCRSPIISACCFRSPLQSPSPLVWKRSICILGHMGSHMVCLRMLMLWCRMLRLRCCCPPFSLLFVHSHHAERAARDFTDINRGSECRLFIGLFFFSSSGDVNCQTNTQWQMEFLNPETAVSAQSEPFFTPITACHNPERLFRLKKKNERRRAVSRPGN